MMNIPSWKVTRITDSLLDDISTQISVGELYEANEICNYVRDTFDPADVFSLVVLGDWARENGFRRLE
jgi:hypothetical protein